MNKQNPNIKHLIHLLSRFGDRYVKHDQLNRANIITDVNHYKKPLLLTLADDPMTQTSFFTKIGNNMDIFEKDDFIQAVRDAGYWLKSHTDYENHVGLAVGKRYLNDSSNVVLDFPHKDCVLRGGMTKEDTRINNVHERFYNDVISRPQITDMFAPKILCQVKRFDQSHIKGIPTNSFDLKYDNLMIKGNNLIALHTLAKRYAGKVKMIYMDPPYNTGKDAFNYNDTFNQSTWLVFMGNRLTAARKLLSNHGTLWISIDSHEEAYLKVLTDEIFGRQNFVDMVTWQRMYAPSNETKTISRTTDEILVYTKNYDKTFKLNRLPRTIKQNKRYNHNDHDGRGPWKSDNLAASSFVKNNYYSVITPSGRSVLPPNGYSWRLSKPRLQQYVKDNKIWFGKNGNNVPSMKRYLSNVGGRVPQTFWSYKNAGDNQDSKREIKKLFGNSAFGTPKPEKLMHRIITLATKKGDLVLDPFMGSATTQAVAMKMNRRFIGIEQMDYIDTVSVPRLQKVINGEQGGVSKATHWTGGGSFVYATFLNRNQKYIQQIQNAPDSDTLDHVYQQMKMDAGIRFDVDLNKYEQNQSKLSKEQKRKCLLNMLNKNQLYYNESDIDDPNVKSLPSLSDSDYKFNKSFYKNGGENND